jgi:hypothetical protein
VPLALFGKYNYGMLDHFGNKSKFKYYFKALTLMTMQKDEKFKDLHDFYFLEHDFYNEFNED